MRVLVAEDDKTSQAMLRAILTKWGYDVSVTDDGEAAYAVFQENNPPQLGILDWEMPGLDGASLCRKLRKTKPDKPPYLILLTARGNASDIVQGLEAGADDYISKPYNNAELKARVNVGRRMILLQNEMQKREKLQGVLEMAGAVCHELNQPLQIVSGFSELLLTDLDPNAPNYDELTQIKEGIDRIGDLTKKIMKITRYQAKPYLTSQIVDIHQASN